MQRRCRVRHLLAREMHPDDRRDRPFQIVSRTEMLGERERAMQVMSRQWQRKQIEIEEAQRAVGKELQRGMPDLVRARQGIPAQCSARA